MSLLSAQALSIVSSLQEIKMDKLRGRVRAGSRFSRDSYIPARLADGMPGPIMGARVRGAATPLLPDRAPQTPETAESLLPLWPSPTVSFPGWEKGDKRKRTWRPQGPEWHLRLCLSSVSSSTVSGVPPPSALLGPARGRATLISMALVLHSNTLV